MVDDNEKERRITFGQKLQKLRNQKCWTKSYTAKLIGISPSAYDWYEKGEREPTIKTLLKITEIFQISADELLKTDKLMNSEETRLKMAANEAYYLIYGLMGKYVVSPKKIAKATFEKFNSNKE